MTAALLQKRSGIFVLDIIELCRSIEGSSFVPFDRHPQPLKLDQHIPSWSCEKSVRRPLGWPALRIGLVARTFSLRRTYEQANDIQETTGNVLGHRNGTVLVLGIAFPLDVPTFNGPDDV